VDAPEGAFAAVLVLGMRHTLVEERACSGGS
jgi:hypothetical protein